MGTYTDILIYGYKYVYLGHYNRGTEVSLKRLIRPVVRRTVATLLGLCDPADHAAKAVRDANKRRIADTWVRRQTGYNLHLNKTVPMLQLLNTYLAF